jgi:glucose/arabinose dehydrogenase
VSPRTASASLLAALLVLAAACGDGGATGARGAPDVTLSPIAEVEFPTAAAPASDEPGELYLAERAGTVRILRDGEVGEPVLDLRGETLTEDEQGLLGLATDPERRHLFLIHTDVDGTVQVERAPIGAGGSLGDRQQLLEVPQPYTHHNGGGVAVGPDGRLYVGLGDGGGWGRDWMQAGQDTSTLWGSVVRLEPDGSIPADNPFVDADGADEIWLFGLRNPWRLSFDHETGDLWIADVGWAEREEVNRLEPGTQSGANLGWRCYEGTLAYDDCEAPGHVPPVFEYGHGPGCAITGGHLYRGSAIPDLVGAYVYSDFCDGTIRALDIGEDGSVRAEWDLGVHAGQVVSFAEDAAGELYVLAADGQVHRLDPA